MKNYACDLGMDDLVEYGADEYVIGFEIHLPSNVYPRSRSDLTLWEKKLSNIIGVSLQRVITSHLRELLDPSAISKPGFFAKWLSRKSAEKWAQREWSRHKSLQSGRLPKKWQKVIYERLRGAVHMSRPHRGPVGHRRCTYLGGCFQNHLNGWRNSRLIIQGAYTYKLFCNIK